jgi:hypothetical protein
MGRSAGKKMKTKQEHRQVNISVEGFFETTLFQSGTSIRNSPSPCHYVLLTWSLVDINL